MLDQFGAKDILLRTPRMVHSFDMALLIQTTRRIKIYNSISILLLCGLLLEDANDIIPSLLSLLYYLSYFFKYDHTPFHMPMRSRLFAYGSLMCNKIPVSYKLSTEEIY